MDKSLNDILTKINTYLTEKNWSLYKLAKESGIQYSSLHSMFEKNTQPTIPTLVKICTGLGIQLSDFFADTIISESFHCTEDEKELLEIYRTLNKQDKKLLLTIAKRLMQE